MKVSGFWVLFFVLETTLILLSFSGNKPCSSIPDVYFAKHNGGMTVVAVNRKLKENGYNPSSNGKPDVGKVNLEDYRPIDPVPSSKASIRPRPIEHGSPQNPYIPRPSPPGPSRNG